MVPPVVCAQHGRDVTGVPVSCQRTHSSPSEASAEEGESLIKSLREANAGRVTDRRQEGKRKLAGRRTGRRGQWPREAAAVVRSATANRISRPTRRASWHNTAKPTASPTEDNAAVPESPKGYAGASVPTTWPPWGSVFAPPPGLCCDALAYGWQQHRATCPHQQQAA